MQGSGFRGHDAVAVDTGAEAVEALGLEVLGERVHVEMVSAAELQRRAEGGSPAAAGAAAAAGTSGRGEVKEEKAERREGGGSGRSRSRERERRRSRSRSRDRRRRSRSRGRGRRRSRSREQGRDERRGRDRSRSRDRSRGRAAGEALPPPPPPAPAAPEAAAAAAAPKPKGGRVVALEVRRGDAVVGHLLVGPMRLHHKCVFGRAPGSDVVLEHLSVSRAHAQLSVDGSGQVLVMDLGSAHGTNLDGTWLRPNALRQLRVGGELKFGASSRTYRLLSVTKQE
jgi:hypothetical protein